MEHNEINNVNLFTEYNKVLYYKKSQSKEVFRYIDKISFKVGDFEYIDFFNIGQYFKLSQTFLYNIELDKEENFFSYFISLKEGEGFDIDANINGFLICRRIFYAQKRANIIIFDFLQKKIVKEFNAIGNFGALFKNIVILLKFVDEEKQYFVAFNFISMKEEWIFDLKQFKLLCKDEDYRDTNPSPTIIEVNEEFVLVNSWHGTGAISTVTGELIWFKEGVMIEKSNEKYVWISSKVYQEYDPMTGNILYALNISSELAQYRLHPTVHNFAFIDDSHLIFTDNIASKLVLFNTQNGKIDWQYAFTDKKGNKVRLVSNPLRIFGKKVYVLDLENTLHIFEHVA